MNCFSASTVVHRWEILFPSWLLQPGPVFLKQFVRRTKDDPLVREVELLHSNPSYAYIKHADGRESTVSVNDLAPCPSNYVPSRSSLSDTNEGENHGNQQLEQSTSQSPEPIEDCPEPTETYTRRSQRVRRAPDRYGWWFVYFIIIVYIAELFVGYIDVSCLSLVDVYVDDLLIAPFR